MVPCGRVGCTCTQRVPGVSVFSKRQRITLRLLYAMSRPSVVCL